MTDARSRSLPSIHRVLLSGVTFIVAAGLLVLGAHELFSQEPGTGSVRAGVFFFCVSAALAFTATAYLRAMRLFVPFGFLVGAAFMLYALAVISMGYEDVGGGHTAVPLSLATAAFGLWLIAAAV
ncbi:MAG: hypothetical protein ACYC6J_10075, partial [Coriobacteriia bacterium]